MFFRVILPCILGTAILTSCSGWTQTTTHQRTTTFSSTSSSKTKNVNVNIKGRHFSLTADDEDATLTLGSKTEKSSHTTYLFAEAEHEIIDDKHFQNGDECNRCDYIAQTVNRQGNLVESAVSSKYKNGEEREYHNGKIIRSSYYVDGAKSGMEYAYVNEKIVDSVYIETIYNNRWSEERLRKALPAPASDYLYGLYFKENYYGFAITTYDSMATHIYYKALSDTGSGFPLVATIEYKNRRDLSNFKVHITKPTFETLTYENNELIQRQRISGNKTINDFKKGEYLKELYTNGKDKYIIKGAIASNVNGTWQCLGECISKAFYENGARWSESYYTDGKLKQEMIWNKKNVVVCDYRYPRYRKSFYDNGTLEQEMQGELMFDTLDIVTIKNGFVKEFYPNGKPKRDDTYENGKYVIHKTWFPNGNIDTEAEIPKYLKQYYENGQLEKSDEGEIAQENDELVLVNGTSKSWFSNGKPNIESIFKNKNVHSLKAWDSTGFLEVDFEKDKYLKTYTNTKPYKHLDWSGNIVYKNNDYLCEGNCLRKEYLDKTMVYQALDENYVPEHGTFKKTTLTQYDSSGKKISEKVYELNELVSQKIWDSEKGFLKTDYNRDSHLKTYYEQKKLSLQFNGKSESSDSLTYINGTETTYHKNGKKASETVWKDKTATSRKEWNENGTLTTEFEFNKTFTTYHPNTKAIRMRYEGTVYFNDHSKKYIVTDGILQSFDENGNQTSTKKYVKGYPVGS